MSEKSDVKKCENSEYVSNEYVSMENESVKFMRTLVIHFNEI